MNKKRLPLLAMFFFVFGQNVRNIGIFLTVEGIDVEKFFKLKTGKRRFLFVFRRKKESSESEIVRKLFCLVFQHREQERMEEKRI